MIGLFLLAMLLLLGIAFRSYVGWLAKGSNLIVRLIVFAVIAGFVIEAATQH